MRFHVLTIFPEMFQGPLKTSILKRAVARGLIQVNLINIRDFSQDKHKCVDDYPFGGGAGMVMKPEPICEGVKAVREGLPGNPRVILLSPLGRTFSQEIAVELAQEQDLILICGHYEGIDERVRQLVVTDEISIGDFVLTGGELPAMVLIDAVARLVPGVLGEEASTVEESFSVGLLEYPHYTRPRSYAGLEVPDVLLSGHHEKIRLWRREQSLRRTLRYRPDLLATARLEREDAKIFRKIAAENRNRE